MSKFVANDRSNAAAVAVSQPQQLTTHPIVMACKIKRLVLCNFIFKWVFHRNIANNLIEKYPTSAAAAIINAIITVVDGVDQMRPPKNGGREEWVGIDNNLS